MIWDAASTSLLRAILRNPAYAGRTSMAGAAAIRRTANQADRILRSSTCRWIAGRCCSMTATALTLACPTLPAGEALPVDRKIERIVLDALTPDKIAIALARWPRWIDKTALQKPWKLRLERARYKAERARRQCDAVEPENRLVAWTLQH